MSVFNLALLGLCTRNLKNWSRGLLPPGEGGPKGRMRAHTLGQYFPHPAFGHPLPVGEGPHEFTPRLFVQSTLSATRGKLPLGFAS